MRRLDPDMTLKSNFILMADYNQWMNENIYSAAAKLSASDLAEDRGAYFGSVLGTLNHIYVADIIWLKRFSDHPTGFKSLAFVQGMDQPASLDMVLHSNLDDLFRSRTKMDSVILEFSHELTDSVLESKLDYKSTRGEPFEKIFSALLQHFFNHQTHHRGQITTLLNQMGVDVGVTDLLVRIPD